MNKNGLKRQLPGPGNIDGVKKSLISIGELTHGTGLFGDLYKLLSNKDGKKGNLRFHTFDIIEHDGKDFRDVPLIDRLKHIDKMPIFRTVYSIVNDEEGVNEEFKKFHESGFEGIVVKNMHERLIMGPNSWVKIKYKDQSDYFVSKIDPILERIEVATIFVDKEVAIKKQCGVKVINKIKRTLKIGDLVTIEHQGVLSDGGLRHPVFIKKV